MLVAIVLLALGSVLPGVLSAPQAAHAIDQDLYDKLTFYWKYATSAYAEPKSAGGPFCAKPNGNTWVANLNDTIALTGTQGYLAVDKGRKEIVVAFRGTEPTKWEDALTDLQLSRGIYASSVGVVAPTFTMVHSGFLNAFNSVAQNMTANITTQLKMPGQSKYSIVATGHSLGGALASLAAASLQKTFPKNTVRLYTYGQPRTGNGVYATWINTLLGDRAFRSVHTNDVVTRLPVKLGPWGYRHHGVEYWQTPDPPSAKSVSRCPPPNPGGCTLPIWDGGCLSPDFESLTCSADPLLLSQSIRAHSTYYGISSKEKFCS